METLNFVIVGHIDHGKSTLIGRLLYDTDSLAPDKIEEIRNSSEELGKDTEFAYLLDHLEEERQQGITIETTQVFFKSGGREYVIIDAPGHVEFVKNMITGASHAEAAVLLIDAAEGVKEQTKRHTYLLSLLGIKQIIVLINKMDLVGYSEETFRSIKEKIEKFLAGIGMEGAFYIPISALKGENVTKTSKEIPWYKGPAFLGSLSSLKVEKSEEEKPLLFPVQDVYKIEDKRVTVGRVEAGVIKKGQTIKILPHEQTTKVKTIEKYPFVVNESSSGESIGITTEDRVFLDRGDIVCAEGEEPRFTDSFYANIVWLSKKDFSKDEKLIIKCATQETTCRIEEIKERINSSTLEVVEENASGLKNLEVGEVLIKTKKPIAVKTFSDVQELGRFVLVKDENTCAGGIVTSL